MPTTGSVVRQHVNGGESLHLVFPQAGDEPYRLDASYLLITPNLTDSFAEALLRKLTPDSLEARVSFNKWLRLGFFRYLDSRARQDVSLGELDAALFRDYVRWLDQKGVDKRKARWSEATRGQYLLAVRNTIDVLKTLPKWGREISAELRVPTHQWRGAKRRSKPTEILADDELIKVYRACLSEITEIRTRVDSDLAMAESGKSGLPVAPTSYRHYPTREIALAALAQMLPERIPSYPELEKSPLLTAIKLCFGTLVDLRTAFAPSPRQLVPFVVMLAFHTRLNPETLLASELDDFYKGEYLGQQRLYSRHYKGRARRRQRPSVPIDENWDNPGSIYDFLVRWTSLIRPLASRKGANKLLIYVPRTAKTHVAFFDVNSPNGSKFSYGLQEFCRNHELKAFSLKQIRPTTLDLGRALVGGDIRAAQVLGDHRNPETTNCHYTSDAQRKRNEERLGEIMSERTRWIESAGKIDLRGAAKDTDEGAATPGFRCFDPYRSPFSPHGKLCVAYGYCAICPLAHIDTTSAVTCAQLLLLLDAVRRAKTTLDPQAWLERMAPIESRLLTYWLPMLSDESMAAARALSLPKLPTPE